MGHGLHRVPLRAPDRPRQPGCAVPGRGRTGAAFCAAYAHPEIEPSDVLESAAAKLRELVAFIERKAAAGDAAQQAVSARGDVIIYERDIAHIEQLMVR